jgi:hypothetical protein
MFHRETLQGLYLGGTPQVEHITDSSAANALLQLTPYPRPCDRLVRCWHVQLSDLLRERHRGEQRFNASHVVALR